MTPRELEAALQGSTLQSALRRGKHLWCPLDSAGGGQQSLYLHFGMTGSLVIKGIGERGSLNGGKKGGEPFSC